MKNQNSTDPKPIKQRYKCKYKKCQFKSRTPSKLEEHINAVHLGLRPYVCDFCIKDFPRKGGLTRHVKVVHKQIKPFKCTFADCDYRAPAKHKLRDHSQTSESDD